MTEAAKTGFLTKSFYNGSTKKEFFHQLRKRHLRNEKEKDFKRRPLPNVQKYFRCFSERNVWKWFPRQQEASNYCISLNEKCVCLFAFEKSDGKRKFLVTSRKQFWTKYCLMKEDCCHFYEVIRTSNPCRLYFDIEYSKELNTHLDGMAVLNILIHMFCKCLFVAFGINCSSKDIVDLDSTTDRKFSRHLIFHFKDDMFFHNNIHCGNFVKDVCLSLQSYIQTGLSNKFFPEILNTLTEFNGKDCDAVKETLKKLLVNTENGESLLCDLSVYSKNRNFRLYRSSKVSKNVPLCIAQENEFVFKSYLTAIEKQVYRIKNQTFDADFQKFSDTLVCPFVENADKIKLLTYSENGAKVSSQHYQAVCSSSLNEYVEGSQKTPYPALDTFVLKQANSHANSAIRRWMFYKKSQMMIYDIGENRWCGNIQRQHKSNHVYYVADLKFRVVYQKCHDPDCANYRSDDIRIPDDINPMVENEDIDQFDVSGDFELNEIFSEEFNIDNILCSSDNTSSEVKECKQPCQKSIPLRNNYEFECFDFDDEDFAEILPKKSEQDVNYQKSEQENGNKSCIDLFVIQDCDEENNCKVNKECDKDQSNNNVNNNEDKNGKHKNTRTNESFINDNDLDNDMLEEYFKLSDNDSLLDVF